MKHVVFRCNDPSPMAIKLMDFQASDGLPSDRRTYLWTIIGKSTLKWAFSTAILLHRGSSPCPNSTARSLQAKHIMEGPKRRQRMEARASFDLKLGPFFVPWEPSFFISFLRRFTHRFPERGSSKWMDGFHRKIIDLNR